jgi:hypothetical protein
LNSRPAFTFYSYLLRVHASHNPHLSSSRQHQIKRSYDVLKPLFDQHIAGDDGQAIFEGKDRWGEVLATCPVESIVNKMTAKWSRTSDDSSSSEKWAQLEAALEEYTAKPKEVKRAMLNKGFELEKWRLELVSII